MLVGVTHSLRSYSGSEKEVALSVHHPEVSEKVGVLRQDSQVGVSVAPADFISRMRVEVRDITTREQRDCVPV